MAIPVMQRLVLMSSVKRSLANGQNAAGMNILESNYHE